MLVWEFWAVLYFRTKFRKTETSMFSTKEDLKHKDKNEREKTSRGL